MFALSVSISTSSSPTATSSPTDFIHLRTVPSSIESERRGITISTLMPAASSASRPGAAGYAVCRARSQRSLQAGQRSADDVLGVRDGGLLHPLRVGHVHVGAGHPLDGRIEVVEGLLRDQRGEVG